MVSRRTYRFLMGATLLGGLLAGLNIDRAFVAMPAWKQLGALAWAVFSQKADLGNGLFLYPFLAIGGLVLNVCALISYRFEKSKSKSGLVIFSLPVILGIGGLIITIKAAPIMLSVPSLGGNIDLVQKAFEDFSYWGGVRGVFQVLTFVADLFVLSTL